MPVFHTKTIESILEPVAQQVSRLVILHEEVQNGNPMPDLSRPVQSVSVAVYNLVKVGRETINVSDDNILKQEIPAALQRVEKASKFLEEASSNLKSNPYSQDACKKLIEGARGILQGTSSLLLCFDDSEVRKIIKECNLVLRYINISEVIESMEDLVQFIKDLSPCLTRLSRSIDTREKELTHQIHREILMRCIESIKSLAPMLICAMKAYIQVLAHGGAEIQEAGDNRNYLSQRITDEVNELIRVLQLTTYDEEEWDTDSLAVMKKLECAIGSKLKPSHDWLEDPLSVTGGYGEKSVRQILEYSHRVASYSLNTDKHSLSKMCGDIGSMTDALCELRQDNKGASPQAEALAKGIGLKLKELSHNVSLAIVNVKQSGFRQPAHTLRGRLEQANLWLDNPTLDSHRRLGQQAVQLILDEALALATQAPAHDKASLAKHCSNINSLTSKMAGICQNGQGASKEGAETALTLKNLLNSLRDEMQKALYHRVVEDFLDVSPALKQFSDVVMSSQVSPPPPELEQEFTAKSNHLQEFTRHLVGTARNLSASGVSTKRIAEALLASSSQIEGLAPQLCKAGKIKLYNPLNRAIEEHFENLRQQYDKGVMKMRDLADEGTDTISFLMATEESLKGQVNKCVEAIRSEDPQRLVEHAGNMARLGNRVVMVASQECDNSEDQRFVAKIDQAAGEVRMSIASLIKQSKSLAFNIADHHEYYNWDQIRKQLVKSVEDVRKSLVPDEAPPDIPPPPDMSKLSISADIPDFYEIFNVDLNLIFNGRTNGHGPAQGREQDKPSKPKSPSTPPHFVNGINGKASSSPVNGFHSSLPENNRLLENSSFNGHASPDVAPPRPPLPGEDNPPPRPPLPPEEEEDDDLQFPAPLPNQPIMMAAHGLHQEVKQWSSQDNEIVAAAKRMALLMANLSGLVRGESGSKKELISCAKAIADASVEVTRLAKDLAKLCTDKRMRTNILQVCERIPTIGTQLRILSTVKATMLGAHVILGVKDDGSELRYGTEEDREATEMLVGNAQNLMQSVKETVRACEVASIKIRTDSQVKMRWVRKSPWYAVN